MDLSISIYYGYYVGAHAGYGNRVWLITRKLKSDITISKWQCFLEMIIIGIRNQIKEIGLDNPEKFIGFIGTVFLFIFLSNLCIIFPGYEPPTGSLSTTVALAVSVFLAVLFLVLWKMAYWVT